MRFNVQRLFLIAVILKVGFSGIGWYVSDPWLFGLALPLSVMAAYIALGSNRRISDVSDEKFADSCYYLGFIFTISSIIFSLFDLPEIGSKMSEIAVRFGVAMITTVAGLCVRVYLVGFKPDVNDAIASAEVGVVDATHRLREQLTMALERMQEFDSRVDEATKATVANVTLNVESLTQSHGRKLTEFFDQLTDENKEAFDGAMHEVRSASNRLAGFVDGYSGAMRKNLQSVETNVAQFTNSLTNRLQMTMFPDDFFVQKLEGPLVRLGSSADSMASHIATVSEDVSTSVSSVRVALATLRSRTDEIDDALDRVKTLAESQGKIYEGAEKQVDTLGVLASTLRGFQKDFGVVSMAIAGQTDRLGEQIALSRLQGEEFATSVHELGSIRKAMDQSIENASLQQSTLDEMVKIAREQVKSLSSLDLSAHELSAGMVMLSEELPQMRQSAIGLRSATDDLTRRLDNVGSPESNQSVNHFIDDREDTLAAHDIPTARLSISDVVSGPPTVNVKW